MRASVYEAAGRPLAVVDVADPRPGPQDLLIKVAYSGVCGTDLHLAQGLGGIIKTGAILGHEFAGEIIEMGRDVASSWHNGDRVTVMPFRPCPACGSLCRNGLDIICPNVAYLGIAAPGGNADYVAVGAAQALPLPAAVDLTEGAMVEPLAVGFHAVRCAGALMGTRVLIIGGGPVGLAVAMFALLGGARCVTVSEPRPAARTRATALGATAVLNPADGDIGEAFRDHAGGAPDIVFECVGTPGMIAEAARLAPLFGRVVVAGACMETDHFQPLVALTKELTFRFVLGHTREDFAYVIDCLARQRIRPASLLTGIVGFAEFPAAFDGLRHAADSCKLLLRPN